MILDISKISEIEKLYGYRIPYKEEYKYYLQMLAREDKNVIPNLLRLEKFEKNNTDIKSAKYKTGDFLIKHFTELFKSNVDYTPVALVEKKCEYLDKHRYVSIDISEANFTVAKKYHNLDLPKWTEYLISLGVDEALAYSKNFRQYVLGYVLGKRIISYEKVEVFNKLKTLNIDDSCVVGINCDEIVLDITSCPEFDYKSLNDGFWKATMFDLNVVENYKEQVHIKTLDDGSKKFYAVDGNNFYIHFKTLILNEKFNSLDSLIKFDNIYFERIESESGLIKREYQYVEKYHKPLVYDENTKEYYIGDRNVYTVIKGGIWSFIENKYIKTDLSLEDYHAAYIKSYLL